MVIQYQLYSEIKAKSPLTRLVIVLRDPGEYNMTELIRLGLHGCLPLRLLPKQIVRAVELILDAGVLMSSTVWT